MYDLLIECVRLLYNLSVYKLCLKHLKGVYCSFRKLYLHGGIRIQFLYPPDLVQLTKKHWDEYEKKHSMSIANYHIPNDNHLLQLLNTMYHLSFEQEESRNIAAKVTYLDPQHYSDVLNTSNKPVAFANVIPFTKAELIRLSPAFNPETSIITICTEDRIVEGGSQEILVIWGVLTLEKNFTKTKEGEMAFTPPTSHLFTIEIVRPGDLIVAFGEEELFNLRGGQLVKYPIKNISEGIIGQHFQPVIDALIEEASQLYPSHDKQVQKIYFQSLINILKAIERKRHGGTIIIVPNNFEDDPQALHIKYQLRNSNIWKKLIEKSRNISWMFDLSALPNQNHQHPKELIDKYFQVKEADERIAEHERFIASLSEVDGAVVMNDRFEILGFGTEIRLTNDKLSSIKKALDPNAQESVDLKITSYGTRHRSAIRYAKHNPLAIVFVISQDGRVKAVKQEKGITYLWDGLKLN